MTLYNVTHNTSECLNEKTAVKTHGIGKTFCINNKVFTFALQYRTFCLLKEIVHLLTYFVDRGGSEMNWLHQGQLIFENILLRFINTRTLHQKVENQVMKVILLYSKLREIP